MMKSLSSALLLALLIFGGQSTFAIPQEYSQDARPSSEQPRMRGEHHHSSERGGRGDRPRDMNNENRPSRGGRWKVGAPVPEMYRSSSYYIEYTQYPKLSPPSRYQQWIKVDQQFLLINVLTNTILKVSSE